MTMEIQCEGRGVLLGVAAAGQAVHGHALALALPLLLPEGADARVAPQEVRVDRTHRAEVPELRVPACGDLCEMSMLQIINSTL